MKENNRSENILMIVAGLSCFSIGIWSNYRQLWLQDAGYSIIDISKILSVALICSSITAFITSFFSSKIKVKSILVLSYILKSLSLFALLIFKSDYIIKICVLLSVMCDVIYSISFYPLLSFESRSNHAFKKKMLVEYFSKDVGVVLCGLLLGYSLGRFVFNYNSCLILAMISTILACIFICSYRSNEEYKKEITFKKSIKAIFSKKINNIFLVNHLISYIAYGVMFDLMMLILTSFVGLDVSYASVFIIVCNMLGTVFSFIFAKCSKDYSVGLSAFIKYGIRAIIYLIAFKINKPIVFIFAIIYAFIMARALEDKVTGTFVEKIEEENQFLYGNIRYLALTLGEGIGAYIAGILLNISFGHLFLGASIITIVQTLIFFYLSKLDKLDTKKY